MLNQLRTARILGAGIPLLACGISAAAEPAGSAEFFEKRIRPVLSEQCYKCHSSTSEKLKGGLMLDSREAWLKGGDTGPAITPGDPEKSLLVEAIRWKNSDMQMPPKKALAPQQIADFEAWVKAGAPWPQTADSPSPNAGAKVATKKVFDLQQRKQEHWCWQPVVNSPVPAVKDSKFAEWPRTDADRFILAKLEEKGLKPAPDASPEVLVRRLSFAITGLPPSPEQVEKFVREFSDSAEASRQGDKERGRQGDEANEASLPLSLSPSLLVSPRSTQQQQAIEHLVDSLLASPHFGERWARHWLDLVRYAETRGHEFDPEIPNAWQYRDYVIRALNSDVPYDRFAAEHIAGDLLPPRTNAQTGANESILGTGFWFLGEEVHSPVDIRQDEADRMDNRLDVMGKTFLGVTIGCARCHDHKFDAISQRDYYAMQGYLISSGYRQARFETLEPHRELAQQLDRVRTATRAALLKNVADAIEPRIARLADALMAARAVLRVPNGTPPPDEGANDSAFVASLVTELKAAKNDPQNPLHAFAEWDRRPRLSESGGRLAGPGDGQAGRVSHSDSRDGYPTPAPAPSESPSRDSTGPREMAREMNFSPGQIVADYTRAVASRDLPVAPTDATPWMQDGFSFGPHPLRAGDPIFGISADQPLLGIAVRSAAVRDAAWNSLATKNVERDQGKLGAWERSEQTLRTPDVALAGEQLWYLVKGAGRAYAAVNSHTLVHGPLHGALFREWKADGDRWQWIEHKLPSYGGHRMHVEFSPADSGDFAIAMVVQSPEKPPLPETTSPLLLDALHAADADYTEGEPRIARMGTDQKDAEFTTDAHPKDTRAFRDFRDFRGQNPSGSDPQNARNDTDKSGSVPTPVSPENNIRDIRVIHGQNPSHPSDHEIRSDIASPVALAEATQRALAGVCKKIRADQIGDEAALADWLVRKLDLFAPRGSPARRQLAEAAQPLVAQQTEITAKIRPNSQTAPAMFDGSGVNEFLLVRGQAKVPAAMVPRHFLEAIAGANQPEIKSGSGRLELAQRIIDPANPLTSRVIVNRVWHHLFGRGIVPTVDNLGVLGQPPSHRELLDHLAARFSAPAVPSTLNPQLSTAAPGGMGWSVKKLIRELVLSRTYAMSSAPADASAEQADPENLLLHRANLCRLEGEAIRDAMLAISGRLDPKVGGPSVPVYLSEFMDGRGKPSRSGPLDGDGRRSIYTAVRRNFLPSMMLAFDTPIPFNAVGRRNVSNVPAQALILMNDPFVVEQAKLLAKKLVPISDPTERVRQMYLAAFSRPPTPEEIADAATFLAEQRALHTAKDADERAWADLAHVLFNVKEFIYLN